MMLSKALYSSEANTIQVGPTGSYLDCIIRFIIYSSRKSYHHFVICFIAAAAKELHDKLLKSVLEQRTAPPNNWLWTLIEKCENREDIKLLFSVLENLRKFRLSNLRIFENFNDNLCREVSKLYAKQHDDVNLMVDTLPEGKRPDIMAELEKLVSEWPLEVVKSCKDEGKMVLAAGLQEDIPAMIDNLSGLGVETNIKMDDLTKIPF
ncbi:hypothetical protein HanPI659440_Chr16g0651121 [Helianthus annuus]|nr:hypothetical protein HanPI659440_Chr16g0651121 [Helianthus annuus]